MSVPQSVRKSEPFAADIAAFIASDTFPCVGAKSALRTGQVTVHEAGNFHAESGVERLHDKLSEFGDSLKDARGAVQTFICAFDRAELMSEEAFEQRLWAHLQALHDLDVERGHDWAAGVSTDPASPDFSVSIAGEGYFVVGLHPGASRPARRFCRPALVFNSHTQFEALRADGRYGRMQTIIREREIARVGSINPMLGNHGSRAQAPQFSGREVGEDWVCPFSVRTTS